MKDRVVTAIEQSPVVNVVAIGFHDGLIALVDLLYDEVISTFQSKDGAVRSLAFSTDPKMEVSLLASCSSEGSGAITFWDLNRKQIHSIV
jgi:U3 small nucleolar RNA-associated protein 21